MKTKDPPLQNQARKDGPPPEKDNIKIFSVERAATRRLGRYGESDFVGFDYVVLFIFRDGARNLNEVLPGTTHVMQAADLFLLNETFLRLYETVHNKLSVRKFRMFINYFWNEVAGSVA